MDLVPLHQASVLYLLTLADIILITVQLILYVHYKDHQVIKATSPTLSLLMFIGCYLQCISAAIKIMLSSTELSDRLYTILSIAYYLTFINGLGLILVTLFVKLVRVYRIFTAPMKNLGKCWYNCPLLFVILLLMVFPNIVFLVFIRQPPSPTSFFMTVTRGDIVVIVKHIRVTMASCAVLISLSIVYIIVFVILCIYITFNSHKVRLEYFNDSNQVIFLLGVTLVNVAITVPTLIVFLLRKNEPVGLSVFTMNSIVFSFSCQLILFFPKISYVVLEKRFLKLQKILSRLLLSVRRVIFY